MRSAITLIMVLPLALLAALVLACGDEGTTTTPAAPRVDATSEASPSATVAGASATPNTDGTSASEEPDETVVPGVPAQERLAGIAGIVPPNFPDATDEDWLEFFEALPLLGEVVGNYAGWHPITGLADLERNAQVISAAPGVAAITLTGFHRDVEGGVAMALDFSDPAQVATFTQDLAAFVQEEHPLLLGIGNEVNRIWEQDADAFDAWVAALPGIAEAIHEAAPETQVFVTFQYEFLRGGGAITGVEREPQWDLLDAVTPHVDLVAFTTYPYFDYETPGDLPADYYTEGAARAGIPVAFTEVAWPSAPLAPLEGSALAGLGGTPEEQAAFIERLPALLGEVAPPFVMWGWAYDTPALVPPFTSLGLADVEGTPKPAWDAWRSFAGR